MRKRLIATVAVVAVGVVLAGCGSSPKLVDTVVAAPYDPPVMDVAAHVEREPDVDPDVVGSNAVAFDENELAVPAKTLEEDDAEETPPVVEKKMYASDFSDTLFIGDSIMVLCEPTLLEKMPAVTVNADGARSLEMGGVNEAFADDSGVLDLLRAGVATPYERVVVGTGSNDVCGMSGDALGEILEILDGKDVWLVTELVTDNVAGSETTNDNIRRAVDAGLARKIDWAAEASKDTATYLADNCHPSWGEGRELYARLAYEALVADTSAGDASSVDEDASELSGTDAKNALLDAPASSDAIMGRTLTTVDRLVEDFESHGGVYPAVYASKGAPTFRDWAEQCVEEAVAEGVRAEVVYAQSMHETGWLAFGGQVSDSQCNFAGIGATNAGGEGASFDTVRKGLRAQVQHLKAYASTDALNDVCVDPRFHLVTRGVAPTLTGLNGRWAVPGDTYGQTIQVTVDRVTS